MSDLPRAVEWYRQVFELGEPDLEPADGVVEFQLGSVWLQLGEEPTARSGAEVVTRFGVVDARAERDRIAALGVQVGPLEHVEGAVDYCDFVDPDGNVLSFYSELS
ncbi:MAG TPA: VOC family protein [Pseudonocardia sp.]|uniref:VOC family protein n=1 Tax=Pseudonocardia sp. TaxID=60912 RepID=UPI002BD2C60C|nr:VOC family protein [Pseudonocardia sp.]HTF47979.1 VOC family protein [Pseudonocardia sp.]